MLRKVFKGLLAAARVHFLVAHPPKLAHCSHSRPGVAPSGAVVELNPARAQRETAPPPQPGTCPQRQEVEPRAPGEKHFSQTPLMDLLLFAKRVYLGVHRRCAAARCAYNRGKQEPSVAEAAPQIGPYFRGGVKVASYTVYTGGRLWSHSSLLRVVK